MPFTPSWNTSTTEARLWSRTEEGKVVCHLSPRNCTLRDGQYGFCGVRQNVDGRLVTLNYGRATQLTIESIETEAVFHYAPGAAILSLGNIGCMMNCDYCHNYKTSQARLVDAEDVHEYTPEEVVDYAQAHGVSILSWTYNDPVVWHEFVLDAGRLAHERGMKNLYKSAFFISKEGAEELCEVVDIFSVSLKTMDPKLYRKFSKGWLEPVLVATKLVFERGKHVEISNLMVTDANDTVDDAKALAEWVLTHLSPDVPLHFVRFHPDYKYTHVGRTPVDRLEFAREAVLEMGIRHCYLGNVYDSPATNTVCRGCGALLVARYGLNTKIVGLNENGFCNSCQFDAQMSCMELAQDQEISGDIPATTEIHSASTAHFRWGNDINSCHVEVEIPLDAEDGSVVQYCRLLADDTALGPFERRLNGNRHRFILSKSHPQETSIQVLVAQGVNVNLLPVYDRAHYPSASTGNGIQLPIINS